MCAFVALQVVPRPTGARANPGEEAKAAPPLELGAAASEISPRSDEIQSCTSQPPTNASARARGDLSTPRNRIDRVVCGCARGCSPPRATAQKSFGNAHPLNRTQLLTSFSPCVWTVTWSMHKMT
jgi:hypothetical protein